MEVLFPGQQPQQGWPYRPAWAALGGYDDVNWLPDPGDEAVTLNRLPRVGEQQMLLVRPNFQVTSHEPFWALYTPTLSYLNGWHTYPEELLASALVNCSLLSVDAMTSRNAIITVRINDVITIPQISQRFPADRRGEISPADFSNKWDRRYLWRTDYGPYRLVDINIQSDLGWWLLCERRDSGWAALIYGEWNFTEDFVYAGHRPLSAAEVESISLEATGLRSG